MIKHLTHRTVISAIIASFCACALPAYAQNKTVVVPLVDSSSALKQVITRTTSFTFPEDNGATGQYLHADIQCLDGELVMGGGYSLSNFVGVNSQPNVIVLISRPAALGGVDVTDGQIATGWYVGARRNVDTVATTVTVYVQCGSN